jgi:YHS domain-containing protein
MLGIYFDPMEDPTMAKLLDPVCGMTVDETALRADGYDDIAFCAPGCRTTFMADPTAYPNRDEASSPGTSDGGCMCSSAANTSPPDDGRRSGVMRHGMELADVRSSAEDSGGCCGAGRY